MEDAGHLVAGLEHVVRDYGVFAVMLAVEAIGVPVPGESLLIFASGLAGRGEMSLPALVVFASAGAVLGDNIGYAIGKSVGRAATLRYGEGWPQRGALQRNRERLSQIRFGDCGVRPLLQHSAAARRHRSRDTRNVLVAFPVV